MTYQKQLEELETLRAELSDRLRDRSSAELNRQPAAGSWSAAQVLAHVIGAERLSLGYLQKKTREAPERIPSSGVAATIKSRALSWFLRTPFRVKAPARAASVPETADWPELQEEWSEVRAAWHSFLEDFPTALESKAIYKHPVAGRLNLEQTLRFLIDHLRRHSGQIDRALTMGTDS